MAEKSYVRLDPGGTYRVGDTRVTLDSLVYAYLQSGSAQKVAEAFPRVDMENIDGAIAFYLANREEVHEYLKRREAEAQRLRSQLEAQPVPSVVARLRATKAAKQKQS